MCAEVALTSVGLKHILTALLYRNTPLNQILFCKDAAYTQTHVQLMPSAKLWLPSPVPNQTALILCPDTDWNVSSWILNKHHPEVWKWFIWNRAFMKSQLEVLVLISDAKSDEKHYNTPALQICPRRGGLPGPSYICSGPFCGIQQDLGFPVHCATEERGDLWSSIQPLTKDHSYWPTFCSQPPPCNSTYPPPRQPVQHCVPTEPRARKDAKSDWKHLFSPAPQGGLKDYSSDQKAPEASLSRSSCVSK